jgi:hypothetical protein
MNGDPNLFDKIQNKIMNTDYPDFNKIADYFGKEKSALQVIKDEIENDETNFFIVENRRLKEMLKSASDVIKDLMLERGYVRASAWLEEYKEFYE